MTKITACGSDKKTLLDIFQFGQGGLRRKINEFLRPYEVNKIALASRAFRFERLGAYMDETEEENRRAFLRNRSVFSKLADQRQILSLQEEVIRRFFQEAVPTMKRTVRPFREQHTTEELKGVLGRWFNEYQKEFKNRLFPVTGRGLSDKDFEEMLLFYRTDAGKKFLKIQVADHIRLFRQENVLKRICDQMFWSLMPPVSPENSDSD